MDDDSAAVTAGMGLALLPSGAASVRVWAPHTAAMCIEMERGARFPLARSSDEQHFTAILPAGAVVHGDRYRFVLETDSRGTEGGPVPLLRRDPYARRTDFDSEWCYVQDHSHYKWATADSWALPPFESYSIYELHVGSFTPEGTFAAATAKLAHVAACGFTAVQLMPILEHSDLWGYNPRQFLSLHGSYGTPDEFKAFVDAAHSLGISVIVDVVLHHGAVDGNALWDYDGWSDNNNGGIYHENAPDTEWGRSLAHWKVEVMDMLKASCAMYIQEYKCDGLRFDSANDLPHDACQALTWACHERFPGVFLTAEVTPENPMAVHHLGFDSLWVHSGYFDIIHQHRALGRGHHGGGEFTAGWDFGKLRTVFALHYGFTNPTQCIKYLTYVVHQCLCFTLRSLLWVFVSESYCCL
jgi:1,4-alpha-glucan branching enzyme